MNNEIPRRIRIDLFTPAELAIYNAMQEVEKMPADTRLTNAVILLSKARDAVADFVDNVQPPPTPKPLANEILRLKMLSVAYTAALEYDHCPNKKEAKSIKKLYGLDLDLDDIKNALSENEGSRPDEVADQILRLIKTL